MNGIVGTFQSGWKHFLIVIQNHLQVKLQPMITDFRIFPMFWSLGYFCQCVLSDYRLLEIWSWFQDLTRIGWLKKAPHEQSILNHQTFIGIPLPWIFATLMMEDLNSLLMQLISFKCRMKMGVIWMPSSKVLTKLKNRKMWLLDGEF